jgi:hypothetical protein
MSSIREIVAKLQTWSTPRKAIHRGRECGFLLSCSTASLPAAREDYAELGLSIDLMEFWATTESAELFVDTEFGQWGLKILSPNDVRTKTTQERNEVSMEFGESDFVIGEFYGDSDQLIIDCSEAKKGLFPVLIKLPIDPRSEWPRVADSFSQFLERYVASQGDKFWEPK